MNQWDLLLDWDNEDDVKSAFQVGQILSRAGFSVVDFETRQSTNGTHGFVAVTPPPDPMTIVALQAILGSDPRRESCNVQRVLVLEEVGPYWGSRWNVFYAPNPLRKKATA